MYSEPSNLDALGLVDALGYDRYVRFLLRFSEEHWYALNEVSVANGQWHRGRVIVVSYEGLTLNKIRNTYKLFGEIGKNFKDHYPGNEIFALYIWKMAYVPKMAENVI